MTSRPADSMGRGLSRVAVIAAIVVGGPLALSGTATAAESGPVGGIAPSAPQVITVESASPGGVWDRLAQCESGGNWRINTGNGYYGGLQFSARTWRAHGGAGMPHAASRGEQIRVAQNVLRNQGWRAWPACSRKLGLRG